MKNKRGGVESEKRTWIEFWRTKEKKEINCGEYCKTSQVRPNNAQSGRACRPQRMSAQQRQAFRSINGEERVAAGSWAVNTRDR